MVPEFRKNMRIRSLSLSSQQTPGEMELGLPFRGKLFSGMEEPLLFRRFRRKELNFVFQYRPNRKGYMTRLIMLPFQGEECFTNSIRGCLKSYFQPQRTQGKHNGHKVKAILFSHLWTSCICQLTDCDPCGQFILFFRQPPIYYKGPSANRKLINPNFAYYVL